MTLIIGLTPPKDYCETQLNKTVNAFGGMLPAALENNQTESETKVATQWSITWCYRGTDSQTMIL